MPAPTASTPPPAATRTPVPIELDRIQDYLHPARGSPSRISWASKAAGPAESATARTRTASRPVRATTPPSRRPTPAPAPPGGRPPPGRGPARAHLGGGRGRGPRPARLDPESLPDPGLLRDFHHD